ncbi:MAG TPA: hypothetical protein VJQ48_00285, partial [Candidatus Binatia bacterium]|nr:hypothetical protein [Candidatus Binatia bacterium]
VQTFKQFNSLSQIPMERLKQLERLERDAAIQLLVPLVRFGSNRVNGLCLVSLNDSNILNF